MHLTAEELDAARPYLYGSPDDEGVLALIVSRPEKGERQVLDVGELDLRLGLVGDNWLARGNRHRVDGSADPLAQVTVMNVRVARLVAQADDRVSLAGDQLYVDLDLSVDNLPPGSRLAIGSAVLEVSTSPHTGCKKFVARFGADAMRFVNSREGRANRWRGVNTRVVVPGTVRAGDHISVTRARAVEIPHQPGVGVDA
jgi:hypothetical protein